MFHRISTYLKQILKSLRALDFMDYGFWNCFSCKSDVYLSIHNGCSLSFLVGYFLVNIVMNWLKAIVWGYRRYTYKRFEIKEIVIS